MRSILVQSGVDPSQVTVLTVGPDSATDAIRKALSMGADKAVHVSDEAIHGSCAVQTSAVIAAALGQLEYDLVLCGAEATDAQLSVMPALLAERLGIPQLSGARKVTIEGGTAKVERQTDGGYWALEAPLPAIVSTWDTINEPRYPSFKGIMAAKKKPVETKSLADLGVEPATIVELNGLIEGKKINDKIARQVLEHVLAGEGTPTEVVEKRGLAVVSDDSALGAAIDDAMAAMPDVVEKIKGGKVQAIGALIGPVMKATRGQADAGRVREIVLEKLGVQG